MSGAKQGILTQVDAQGRNRIRRRIGNDGRLLIKIDAGIVANDGAWLIACILMNAVLHKTMAVGLIGIAIGEVDGDEFERCDARLGE